MSGEVTFQLNEAKMEEVFASLEHGGVVTYTTDYAHHIEFDSFWGSTAPPFSALRDWVDRKWPDLNGELKDEGMPTDEEGNNLVPEGSPRHRDGVTWVVVNSIQETGILGIFYGRRSLEYGKQQANSVASEYEGTDDPRASEKIVEDILDLMFETSQDIIAEEASDTGNLLQSGLVDTTEDLSELPEAN